MSESSSAEPAPVSAPPAPPATPPPKPPWRRRLRKLAIGLFVAAVFVRVAAVALAPTILDRIARGFGLACSVEGIELSALTGELQARKLVLAPAKGGAPVFELGYVRADISMPSLLAGSLVVRRLEVDGVEALVEREADGRFVLEKLAPVSSSSPAPVPEVAPAPQRGGGSAVAIQALRVSHVHVRVKDASVSPPLDARLEAHLRVDDLVLSETAAPAFLELQVSCPPVLDSLRVEGSATPGGHGELSFLLDRLHLGPLAGYLEAARIEPVARDISFGFTGTADVHGTAAIFSLQHVALTADGREALALDALGVDVRELSAERLDVARVSLDGLRADAVHLPDASIRVAGIAIHPPRPLPDEAPPEEPARAPSAPSPRTRKLVLDELTIGNVRASFTDEATNAFLQLLVPVVSVRGIDELHPDRPGEVSVRLAAPRVVEKMVLAGTVQPFGARPQLHANLSGEAITLRAVAPYLRKIGMEPLLASGGFSCGIDVFGREGRPLEGDAALHDLVVYDGPARLAEIWNVKLRDVKLDPEENHFSAASVRIDDVTLPIVRRDRARALEVCGLKITPSLVPVAEEEAPPRPKFEKSGRTGKPLRLGLGELRVANVVASFEDAAVAPATSFALTGARLALGAVDLDLSPDAPKAKPTPLDVRLATWGVADEIALVGTLVASAREPSLALALTARGFDGRAAAPYLALAGIEPRLGSGVLEVAVRAGAAIDPAGPVRGSAAVERASLVDGSRVLLDVAGLRAEDVRYDTTKRDRVEVGLLGLERFSLPFRREAGAYELLGFHVTPAEPAPVGSATEETGEKPLLAIGKVRLRAAIDYTDAAAEPAYFLPLSATAEVGPLSFDLSSRAPLEDALCRIEVDAPGLIDSIVLSGTLAASPSAIRGKGELVAKGITASALRERLEARGIEPLLRAGTFRVSIDGHGGDGKEGELHVREAVFADGSELGGFDSLDVTGIESTPSSLTLGRVALARPRGRAERDAQGGLVMGGLRFTPGQTREGRPSAGPSTLRQGSGQASGPASGGAPRSGRAGSSQPFVFTIEAIGLQGSNVAWRDASRTPTASVTLLTDASSKHLVFGDPLAKPAAVTIGIAAPGVLERGTLAGTLLVAPGRLSLDAALDLAGVRAGTLEPYLAPARSELENGRLHAILGADWRFDRGTLDATILDLDARDGARRLLHVDRLAAIASSLSSSRVALDEVALTGVESRIEKTAAGTRLLGLVFPPRPATEETEEPPAPSPRRAKHAKAPLVSCERFRVGIRELAWQDRTQQGSEPLAVSSLEIANRKPIRLLGPDPASQPPIELDLEAAVAPLASRVTLKARAAPFAQEPDVALDLAIDGLRGAGLARVSPALAKEIDGSGLADGHLRANASLELRTGRRDPLDFDFAKGLGLELLLRQVALSEGKDVLAGLDELHLDVARIDSSTLHVRGLEVARPAGLVRREKDGLMVAGLLLRDHEPAPPPPPSTSHIDLKLDRFGATDIAFRYEDVAADPPFLVPLVGLDASASHVAAVVSSGFHLGSLAFDAVLKAGKVPLPKREKKELLPGTRALQKLLGGLESTIRREQPKARETEERPFFDEIAAKGDLTFGRHITGKLEASLSALELENLEGPAKRSGITLEDGVADADAKIQFKPTGEIDVRSHVTLTDLEVGEEKNGPISRSLALPAPLEVVVVVLRDDEGAIEIPLHVKIPPPQGDADEDGKAIAWRIRLALVSTLGAIVGHAIERSPFRALGTVTGVAKGIFDMIPGSDLIPFLERPKPALDPEAVRFETGDASVRPLELAKLEAVKKKLQEDEELVVALRHAGGAADLERARIAANPSPRDRRDLLGGLSTRRADLERERLSALAVERDALAREQDGEAATARNRARRLQDEIANVDRALEQVYELERDGAERQAGRRTRALCLAIAETRLEEVRAALGLPEERVRVGRPRFEEAPAARAGTVTLTFSRHKKP